MRFLLLVVALAACSRSSTEHEQAPPPVHPTDTSLQTTPSPTASPGSPVAMTHTDPKDPAAWTEAEKIAAAQGAGKVSKRSDALPFLFQGDRARAVLIHKGQIL